jgi:hypothetical protein
MGRFDFLCTDRDYSQFTGGCDFELGIPDYAIFTPYEISITATDAENLIDFLRGKSDPAIDAALRYYPVYGQIKRVTDESTEPTMGALNKGYQQQLLPGRSIYLFEWPSSVLSDMHIERLNRWTRGVLIINNFKLLIGSLNTDGTMGALPCEVGTYGGGFAGSGGDIQTKKLRIDFGAQDALTAGVHVYRFKETDRFENIIPMPTGSGISGASAGIQGASAGTQSAKAKADAA